MGGDGRGIVPSYVEGVAQKESSLSIAIVVAIVLIASALLIVRQALNRSSRCPLIASCESMVCLVPLVW